MTNLEKTNHQDRTRKVYMISDSSGETVSVILRAVAAQLVGVRIEAHLYPLVKTTTQIDEVLKCANQDNGVILCTMADDNLFDYLITNAKAKNIPYIEVLSKIIKSMARYFEATIDRGTRQPYIDNNYFKRIDAINFTLEHDDGQSLNTIYKSDIILVGISRTSKSPTSVYLANRGYFVANIPFVCELEEPLPSALLKLKQKLIIALIIDPVRLVSIRKNRIKHINADLRTDYINHQEVINESKKAQNFYHKMNWPIIDVTEKAIEEISAMIIQYLNKFSQIDKLDKRDE